jgi:hypothetical protein
MADPTPTPAPAPPAFSRDWWLVQLQLLLPTNWRQLVQWVILLLCIKAVSYLTARDIPTPEPPLPVWTPPPDGWVPPTEDDRRATFEALRVPRWRNTEAGQQAVAEADYLVYRLAAKGRGRPIPDKDQSQIGTCVSMGFTTAEEVTMAAQVAIGKQFQNLPDLATEAVYGGSRVNANGGRLPPDMRGQDGSVGAWAAKWMETVGGALPRGKYPTIDLSAYSVDLSRRWGNVGVPADLVALCRKHPAHCTLVQTAAECKAALAQGYAVAVCSNVGFDSHRDANGRPTRDAEGFLAPAGSWGHCMAIVGYRSDRAGFLVWNSWGSKWVAGPKGKFDDIPDGSFWVDATVVERMLRQKDSYALANADGFKARVIKPDDWIVAAPRKRPVTLFARGGLANGFALAP